MQRRGLHTIVGMLIAMAIRQLQGQLDALETRKKMVRAYMSAHMVFCYT